MRQGTALGDRPVHKLSSQEGGLRKGGLLSGGWRCPLGTQFPSASAWILGPTFLPLQSLPLCEQQAGGTRSSASAFTRLHLGSTLTVTDPRGGDLIFSPPFLLICQCTRTH